MYVSFLLRTLSCRRTSREACRQGHHGADREGLVVECTLKGAKVIISNERTHQDKFLSFSYQIFKRKFCLPDNCKEKDLKATSVCHSFLEIIIIDWLVCFNVSLNYNIGTDGFLRVTVPRSQGAGAKIHHIKHTGYILYRREYKFSGEMSTLARVAVCVEAWTSMKTT